jgi:hypothetical protein
MNHDAHQKALIALFQQIQHHRQLDGCDRSRAANQNIFLVFHFGVFKMSN